jgi:hypothetical protein
MINISGMIINGMSDRQISFLDFKNGFSEKV